ncbi:MAG: glycosyltransferase family 9 protein [Ignavibacteria bacterium]|nr:glycosyltransferase family 9 protein [Ignavibacteria bacterium]
MNIVIIQTAFLGDVLLTLPLCVAVKRMLPQASITFVTTPAAAPMLASVSCIDRVVVYDKRGEHATRVQQQELAASLTSSERTIVLVAHKSWRSALFLRSINADFSVAFADSPARWFATSSVSVPSGLHAAERNLLLLKPLLEIGVALPGLLDCVPIVLTDVEVKASSGHPHVVLAPGSAWKTKQWPTERFRELAQRLVHEGIRVSVLGDASVAEVASGSAGVDNLAGSTTMQQAAGVIAGATIVVANDSAPVHLASLQNVPTIAIFGPTIPEFGFGPFGSDVIVVQNDQLLCRPCSDHGTQECPLGTHECMTSITVDKVYSRIQRLLHAHDENRHASTTI